AVHQSRRDSVVDHQTVRPQQLAPIGATVFRTFDGGDGIQDRDVEAAAGPCAAPGEHDDGQVDAELEVETVVHFGEAHGVRTRLVVDHAHVPHAVLHRLVDPVDAPPDDGGVPA